MRIPTESFQRIGFKEESNQKIICLFLCEIEIYYHLRCFQMFLLRMWLISIDSTNQVLSYYDYIFLIHILSR